MRTFSKGSRNRRDVKSLQVSISCPMHILLSFWGRTMALGMMLAYMNVNASLPYRKMRLKRTLGPHHSLLRLSYPL